MWVGSLMLITRLSVPFASGDGPPGFRAALRRAWVGFGLGGCLITLASGLYQFLGAQGPAHYLKQGWFHTKLTFVIVLLFITVLVELQTRLIASGGQPKKGKVMALHGVAGLCFLAIVFVTLIARFGSSVVVQG